MGHSERRGSVGADRRSSQPSPNGDLEIGRAVPRASRASITSLRPTRRSLVSTSIGMPIGTGPRGGNGIGSFSDPLLQPELVRPSPTAMRLRSLARSVRAANTLGVLKVRKRYLASTPMPAAGTVTVALPADDKLNPSGARVATASAATARVIVLPTHEFSTAAMKFRLDPLESNSTSASWNVHGALDMLAPSTDASGRPSTDGRPSSASTSSTTTLLVAANSSGRDGLDKARWKTSAAKTTSDDSTSSDVLTATASAALRRGQSHSADAKKSKRSSSNNFVLDRGSFFATSINAPGHADDLVGLTTANIEARLCCARSLYKLSCQDGCELSIINGDAIAQLAEFSDVDHVYLHQLCAATLANLTIEPSATDAFVAHGGIPALLELSWSPSIGVKLMCVTALCRLSRSPSHAATLARSRASIEFVSMMTLPFEQVQRLAISCIINLIYFGHSFPDRIFLGEPHAIQNQLGILTITSQLAMAPQTMPFAAEVLFNLALYRTSCSGALRGGGADFLYGLAVHVGKALDEHHSHTSSSNTIMQQLPRLSLATAMSLLKLIAHTLANFTAHTEFQTLMSGPAVKTLTLILFGALRDLGSRFYGGLAEERLRILAVPCSRALANLSSADEQPREGFSTDLVQLTTRLFLLNRAKLFPSSSTTARRDKLAFQRNILRALTNLSFHEACTAQVMEFPEVMPQLTKVVLRRKNEPLDLEEVGHDSSDDDDEDEDEKEIGTPRIAASREAERRPSMSDCEDTGDSPSGAICTTQDQTREDALIAILNLAQQGAYSHELLKHLDGRQLALAAEEQDRGSRIKYVYDVVLCNLLFESRLQQLVYGDGVVNSLIDGFYFFSSATLSGPTTSWDSFSSEAGSLTDATVYRTMNLAFQDDQERFLTAIVAIAGELLDPRNIERLVLLALDCIRPMDASMTPAQRKRRRHLTCYGSAILYTLARSSATRGDASNRIYTADTVQTLIDVCERNATPAMDSGSESKTSSRGPFSYCAHTQAFCAATLYHICATGHFTPRVIQALISACNSNEESLSLLACSAAFAIISFTPEGRQQLTATDNFAMALNRLGRTSQVECQQYAAIAACNVSTVHCIWSSNELKDFIVIALLRANSAQAKQIHAKTLANLLSHIKTRAKAVEDGVLYALMKLSQVIPLSGAATEALVNTGTTAAPSLNDHHHHVAPNPPAATSQSPDPIDEVFQLGLQVLFNLSCEPQYHQKLMGNGVISYLATGVISTKQAPASAGSSNHSLRVGALSAIETGASLPLSSTVGTDSRRFAMGIICNLSSYEVNHKELMNAQVIEIIRSYVDHDVETRASAAMAVRNLSCRQPWVEMICERRTLQMLISFTHCDHPVVKHFAIQALANCSQVTDSLHLFGELKVTRAVMAVLESMRPPGGAGSAAPPLKTKTNLLPTSASLADSRETSMAALKCLHNVAADDSLAQNLMEESAILRLTPIMESRALDTSEEACVLAATMISVLAGKPRCAEALLLQRVVGFCALLHRTHPHNAVIAFECAVIVAKLSTYQPIQAALTETQAIQVLVSICSSMCACSDQRIRECGAIAIRNLTLSVAEHPLVFYDEAGFEEELAATKAKAARRNSPDTHFRPARPDSAASVGRLAERHLMQGVKYFQQELERVLSDSYCSGTEQADICLRERILVEACAGIANLSTVKSFRIEMVRAGVVPTLLRLFQISPNSATIPIPAIARSMCCATLHRLALEEEATVDGRGLLVPSLLEILHQSDEELHQVRYECEKVSFPSVRVGRVASRSATKLLRSERCTASAGSSVNGTAPLVQRDSVDHVSAPPTTSASPPDGQPALIATTICIKQNYREPKWTAYVVKTMLSSASMVPQLNKKQIRAIGLPKLSFFDADSSNLFAVHAPDNTGTPNDNESASKRKGGYLLPVHTDKFTSYLAVCLRDGATGEQGVDHTGMSMEDSFAARSTDRASTRESSHGGGTTHDRESMVHSRKFDRHMRLTRRNHRRTNVLPVLSFT